MHSRVNAEADDELQSLSAQMWRASQALADDEQLPQQFVNELIYLVNEKPYFDGQDITNAFFTYPEHKVDDTCTETLQPVFVFPEDDLGLDSGEGEAMSGLLLAGQRDNGEVPCLVFLLD